MIHYSDMLTNVDGNGNILHNRDLINSNYIDYVIDYEGSGLGSGYSESMCETDCGSGFDGTETMYKPHKNSSCCDKHGKYIDINLI